jgi:3-methyl-2-oxobutanoate hydroxymethyltransferase
MTMKRTVEAIRTLVRDGEKLVMLTAYDCETARLIGKAGIDMILVGDSLGMVVLGYENTLSVTMDDMVRHTAAVTRAKPDSLVVADLPHLSYESPAQGVANAGRLMREGLADAVKLEGCKPDVVAGIVSEGIPVMGHIGLTPQTVEFRVQGRDETSAQRLLDEAVRLENAGCFALVLECVPRALGRRITEMLEVPTIGIGAGPDCDGQVLVSHDVLGLFERFTPRFVKRYAELGTEMQRAFDRFRQEVKDGRFPENRHSFT